MEIRQPKMAEVVGQVSTVAANVAQNAHITLRELKEKIDAVVEQKLPTFKTLMEQKPVAVAQTTVNDASLTVYENGYAVYEVNGAHTVMRMCPTSRIWSVTSWWHLPSSLRWLNLAPMR